MDYREVFRQENDNVRERFELSMERIQTICTESDVEEPFRDYFKRTAKFILTVEEMADRVGRGFLETASLEDLKVLNSALYQDILPGSYEESYANPAYAYRVLGGEYGKYLSFLYAEIRGDIVYAFESRLFDITILNELFIEIYNMFEGELPSVKEVRDALYWFVSDYSDVTLTYRIRELLDPDLDFAVSIIRDSDLTDIRYLYRFGEFISDRELLTASYLNSLPQETIDVMANTLTKGYRKGFEIAGKDLSGKKTVVIRYELGFERMIKKVLENFQSMGLCPVIYRSAVNSINKNPNGKVGYFSSSPNKQYDYDHRYDNAVYMDKGFKERKLSVLKVAYEEYKEKAAVYAGPVLIEVFGEDGFEPVNKQEAFALNEKQQKISIEYANEAMQIQNMYIPGEETSFSIIAFPVPEIGKDFQAIFADTIKINTLDYEKYKEIQQSLIDSLDQAEFVTVAGRGKNETDLKIKLHPLADPESQSNFENCLADVNIPVGEVFTSPRLKGTEGLLHVGNVYIGDIQFKNLKMRFEDGFVLDYSCENFETEQAGKDLVRQVIMKNHDTLPMGEFAIGTNTTAYAMAMKYHILEKLPILIVEKMGPHFAVGDTCYSWSEDSPVYNPDGKEIIARDNEVSILRKEDLSKAYLNCHTDITIPYSELGDIKAVKKDGTEILIISDGRFVLKGTEELNKPLT